MKLNLLDDNVSQFQKYFKLLIFDFYKILRKQLNRFLLTTFLLSLKFFIIMFLNAQCLILFLSYMNHTEEKTTFLTNLLSSNLELVTSPETKANTK